MARELQAWLEADETVAALREMERLVRAVVVFFATVALVASNDVQRSAFRNSGKQAE